MDVYSDNRVLVYVDTDEQGNITAGESGKRIIPARQYQHFFITEDERALELENYKVENDQLVLK